MSLTNLVLAIWVFLMSASDLGWFIVSSTVVGIIGLILIVLLIVEGIGLPVYRLPS